MAHLNPVYVEHLQQRLEQARVPQTLHRGLVEYIAGRGRPGQFLVEVLSNSLSGAVTRADDGNRLALAYIVLFLINYAPDICWGSPEHVEAWLNDPQPAPEVFE
jgi:hypothetical protein